MMDEKNNIKSSSRFPNTRSMFTLTSTFADKLARKSSSSIRIRLWSRNTIADCTTPWIAP